MQRDFRAERPLGYQQITNLSAAVGLTIPAGAAFCLVTPSGQAVRWRDDGTNPTASVGYPLPVGAEMRYSAQSFGSLKFIEVAASAVLDVCFYG